MLLDSKLARQQLFIRSETVANHGEAKPRELMQFHFNYLEKKILTDFRLYYRLSLVLILQSNSLQV